MIHFLEEAKIILARVFFRYGQTPIGVMGDQLRAPLTPLDTILQWVMSRTTKTVVLVVRALMCTKENIRKIFIDSFYYL